MDKIMRAMYRGFLADSEKLYMYDNEQCVEINDVHEMLPIRRMWPDYKTFYEKYGIFKEY